MARKKGELTYKYYNRIKQEGDDLPECVKPGNVVEVTEAFKDGKPYSKAYCYIKPDRTEEEFEETKLKLHDFIMYLRKKELEETGTVRLSYTED